MPGSELTTKQKAFVEYYAGNATEAAIKAGYSKKTADRIGPELLGKTCVAEAIQTRQEAESRRRIATRQKRQEFWTSIMEDAEAEMKDRIKASELLGKSEGDFLNRHDHTSSDGSLGPGFNPARPLVIEFISAPALAPPAAISVNATGDEDQPGP